MVTGHEEEFRRLFVQEVEGQLANISRRAHELEGEEAAAALVDLYREAHTMRGSSALVGFGEVTVVARALEDLFEELRSGQREAGAATVAAILGAVETVREMVPALVDGQDRSAAAGQAADALRDRSRPTRGRVLVVDDAATVRELQRSILERAGYEVEVAGDGRAALQLLASQAFDLVLADLEMPELDGLRLIEAIRADQQLAGLPVIIITSSTDEADRRRGLDAGANGYMVKNSFDEAGLLGAVDDALGGAG
jgi:two-component system chemotaxis sensor kinase CheA